MFHAAASCPGFARLAMQVIAPHVQPHWALSELVRRLHCRIPATAQLSNGMRMRVLVGDGVSDAIRRDGYYELITLQAITSLLTPSSVFFDIGAHMGHYTLFASPLCREVHCFEAMPPTFEILEYNIRANRLANVTLSPCAVSDRSGKLTMYEGGNDNLGSSSLTSPSNASGRTFTVRSIALDDYATSICPDLLKIDIEGAEVLFLHGAATVLRQKHPTMFMEINDAALRRFGFSARDLIAELNALDYRLTAIERRLEDVTEHCVNIVASPGSPGSL